MGIFSRLKGVLKRRKEEPLPPVEIPKPEITAESATAENMRAKINLVLTQLESLSVRQDTLNERIDRMEKTINEIYAIAKRTG